MAHKYEAKKVKWNRLHDAVGDFLAMRSHGGFISCEDPIITKLIEAYDDCEQIKLEEK